MRRRCVSVYCCKPIRIFQGTTLIDVGLLTATGMRASFPCFASASEEHLSMMKEVQVLINIDTCMAAIRQENDNSFGSFMPENCNRLLTAPLSTEYHTACIMRCASWH